MKGISIREVKRRWQDEEWDKYLPSDGFLTDFVMATRGIETPTQLSLWAGIFTISTLLKRDAYLDWYPSPLYPNMFVIMVAPPRICAKSTIARVADEILTHLPDEIQSKKIAINKRIRIIRSKATPEGISMMLKPSVMTEIDEDTNKVLMIHKDSHLCIIISELSTLINKKLYNQGIIGKLTDLYDCKVSDSDVTQGRGEQVFKNIYVTMLGATTLDGLKAAIPEEAFGDGFMSRVILVNQQESTRSYPMPFDIPEISVADLVQRAAYIAEHSIGGYVLTDEAKEWYEKFYVKYKNNLYGLARSKNTVSKMLYRYDINLLKLALIVHVSTYKEDHEITVQDMLDANRILKQTYKANEDLSSELIMHDDFQRSYRVISNKLARAGKIQRRDLLKFCSGYSIKAAEVTRQLNQLLQEGLIEIYSENGLRKYTVTTNIEDIYKWIP